MCSWFVVCLLAFPFGRDEVLIRLRVAPLRNPFQQDQKNEPFGLSGTRCLLFDDVTEESLLWEPAAQNWQINDTFACRVGGPREAGRYNLSVALLGVSKGDWNQGESFFQDWLHASDHKGVRYHLQYFAHVSSVLPSTSGLLGGARLTVRGGGFSDDPSIVKVNVQGTDCHVISSTLSEIVCELAENDPDSWPVDGEAQPGGSGLRQRVYWDHSSTDFIEDVDQYTPDEDSFLNSFFEMGDSLMSTRDTPYDIHGVHLVPPGSLPAWHWEGLFRAPVTSN
mmetsp:Transcript_45072/g.109779  ORF Transcript_45072/g.109779 Transcript_45072/m.109779 type:complete len:280 (-) Transcript_45072:427-1266(-)